MYFEFLYLPLDYFSTLTRRAKFFEFAIPLILAILSCILEYKHNGIQLSYINKFVNYAEIVLGFILTALSIIVSSDKFKTAASKFPSRKEIRHVPVSLYRVLITEFSFIILNAALIITSYFIALAIPIKITNLLAIILNGLFIMLSFTLLFSTIRAITNLYYTQLKRPEDL